MQVLGRDQVVIEMFLRIMLYNDSSSPSDLGSISFDSKVGPSIGDIFELRGETFKVIRRVWRESRKFYYLDGLLVERI